MDDVTIRLGARGLSKAYGAVEANRDISLDVAPAQIHAIVGENGAGKSTLMRCLQGIERPDAGTIIVDDNEVTFTQPQQALNLGIGMVHQEFMLAPDLTLLENLVLGDEPERVSLGVLSRVDWGVARTSGETLAAQAGVTIDWSRRSASAPVHVQQFVEILRLLRRGTRILILDEPTAVLAPQQVDDLFALLRRLRDGGTTILFISHKLREVTALADRVTVLRRGEVTYQAAISDTDVDTIASHIVGGGDSSVAPVRRASNRSSVGASVFDVTGLSVPSIDKSHALHDVHLSVKEGEIVGIAGVAGNGQDELVECLVGLRAPGDGQVRLRDADITRASNTERRARGIAYISADRRHEGLAIDASVEANVIAGSQRSATLKRGYFLSAARIRALARDRLERLNVTFGSLKSPASSLSGGNQQRLVFARETDGDPSFMMAAQPTRGVDIRGIEAIHRILWDFRDRGGAVLLVSEEMDELLALSDRILVMSDGRIVGEVEGDKADPQSIGRLMVLQDREPEPAHV
ncbi:MAG: ABC transporter ATP-binding protein [Alphaproteobacteria bacterium]|nr:ABC transporter ATP-binding protein [Alphaproteobacteria bacterium]